MNEQKYREAEASLFADAGIEPRETWLDLDRTGVRARALEVGTGTPVVFLHGGPMAAATWSYVAAHLRDVRAILVDRPGCGLSEPPPAIPDATDLASYVATVTTDVLDALELGAATLVGSSFGGYSALRSALEMPGRIDGVFLAGYPPFGEDSANLNLILRQTPGDPVSGSSPLRASLCEVERIDDPDTAAAR